MLPWALNIIHLFGCVITPYQLLRFCLLQKADIAIADLTITYDREQAVDFTMPFMNLGEHAQ
jgi:ABC-type amino acid transport substrate-binding protein